MNNSARLQIITGFIWLILGILIVIWFLIPSEELMVFIWWGFAIGCIIAGISMIIEPYMRDN